MAYKANLIDETASDLALAEALAALNNIGEFAYNDSNGYLSSRDNSLNEYKTLLEQGYQSQYKTDIDSLFEQIINYGDFSYDQEKDNLFQIFKQQYQREGQQAMKNQLGVATAQTGGYNNSYAQSSAQQAYQNSMNQLNDKATELYANAFSQYQNEYNNLLDRYSLVNEADQREENNYYNRLNTAKNSFDTFNSLYGDDYQNQYNAWSDNANQIRTNYSNAVSQNNWIKEFNANETNNANVLNQKADQFDAEQDERIRHNNAMEKIAKRKAKGKTSTTKKKK